MRSAPVLVVASDSDLAASGRPPTLAELAHVPLIARESCPVSNALEQCLRTLTADVDVAVRTPSGETAQALCGTGVGVAAMARFEVDATDPRTTILHLASVLPDVSISLVWHRERVLSGPPRASVKPRERLCRELHRAKPPPALAA